MSEAETIEHADPASERGAGAAPEPSPTAGPTSAADESTAPVTTNRHPSHAVARPSTARPPTPATGSSHPTTPRSRPISRSRSTRPAPDRTPEDRPGRSHRRRRARHGRRPRLRQPVRPADRASRPRAQRLLGAAAPRHAVAELERRGRGRSSCRAARTPSTTRTPPSPTPAIWSGRIPVLGICYGAQLMALELGGDVAAGRPSASTARRPCRSPRDDGLFGGIDREQPVWMSHGDSITRLPEGFQPPPRPTRRRSPASPPRSATCTASSSTPRSSTRRAAGTSCATSSSDRRARADLDAGELRRVDGRRDPRAGRRARPRDRLRRPGHLRAVGRRGLRGRGRARPPRGRRPADLHLRRPRADAQEGVRAAPGRPSRPTSACAS